MMVDAEARLHTCFIIRDETRQINQVCFYNYHALRQDDDQNAVKKEAPSSKDLKQKDVCQLSQQ